MHSHSRRRREFEAIGTHWQIDTDLQLTTDQWSAIDQRIEEFDRTWSRFRSDSLVSKVAAGPGSFAFPPDAGPLFAFYRRLYELTGGAVTPLIGGALEHLGYDAGYRLSALPGRPTTPDWDAVMTWDGNTLDTAGPVVLDVGAAGKGYLVDIIGELLLSMGVTTYVVDGSGDLAHRGPDVLRVGMEHPADPSKVIGVVPLGNACLAASAANRRAWGSPDRALHHIVDPASGDPVGDVVATWVVADSAMVADGLATALFFLEPAARGTLESDFGARWARVTSAGAAQWSPQFEGELFR